MPGKPSHIAGIRFKQFSVAHDMCATKIETESIILGCWVKPSSAECKILDIGSGCGILTFMMAQQAVEQAQVVGVDVDINAFKQSCQNAAKFPWSNKIHFAHTSIAHFYSTWRYELIISNPPVDEGSDGLALTHTELLEQTHRLLTDKGRFCCVVPASKIRQFETTALEYGLFLNRRVDLHSGIYNVSVRSILEFSYSQSVLAASRLVIYAPDGSFTSDYKSLCHDFYLAY